MKRPLHRTKVEEEEAREEVHWDDTEVTLQYKHIVINLNKNFKIRLKCMKWPRHYDTTAITIIKCIPNSLYGVDLKIATVRSEELKHGKLITRDTRELLKYACGYPTTPYNKISCFTQSFKLQQTLF